MSTKLKETTKVFSYILPVWSLWYLGVLLIIYIISHIFSNEAMSSFFGFMFTANRTYMLVIGIIVMIGFLEWAIGMGVSRKTFFKSVVLTGIITMVMITAIAGIVPFILSFTPFSGDYLFEEDLRYLSETVYVIFHFLSGLLLWAAGLLISASFMRGFWAGMLSVLSGILAITLLLFSEQLLNYLSTLDGMMVYLGLLLMIILIVIYNWILYAVIKNIPIKIR